jgi:hypothetical protein
MTLIAEPIESPDTSSISRLPEDSAHREPSWMRRVFRLLACGLAVGFLALVFHYFAPGLGQPGIDENAYLGAGRNIAHHLTPGFRPASPYAFIGPMWIRSDDGWYYPKYPAGVPLLDALAIWATGGHNNLAACCVSPICAAAAVLAMFFLTRMLAGSLLGFLGALALATNATLLQLALVPSSHAPDICFVTWGMFALLSWWKCEKTWVGIAAGLLLGYAVSIRYSEGLLLFPLATACALHLRGRRIRAVVPLFAWLLPVALLAVFNRMSSGHWTGYDTTRENTAFTLGAFQSKWEFTVGELNGYGMFLILPLGVAGMLLMLERSWRVGVTLLLWFVPSLLLYMAYYWVTQGVGYMRLYLTIFPPVIVAAMWMLRAASPRAGVAAAIFVALVAADGLHTALPAMSRLFAHNQAQADSARQFLQVAGHRDGEPEPLLIGEDDGGMIGAGSIMYLQAVSEGEWISARAFTLRGGRGFGGPGGPGFGAFAPGPMGAQGGNAPMIDDPRQTEFLKNLYAGKTQQDLEREEMKLVNDAIDSGRPVYAVLSASVASEFRRRLAYEGFVCNTLATWHEPAEAPDGPGGGFGGGPGPGGGPGGFGGPGGGFRGPGAPGFGGPFGPNRFGRGGESSGPQTITVMQVVKNLAG